MIHAVGDSHAMCTFAGITDVTWHHVGPVTMKRVGYPEDDVLSSAVAAIDLRLGDTLVLCFGEIDVRCYAHPNALRARTDLRTMLGTWVRRYLTQVARLATGVARVGVLSVPPPTPREQAHSADFPVAGSDQDRVLYTTVVNDLLRAGCEERGLLYVDVYTGYADQSGMLTLALADETVHIKDTGRVRLVLERIGLLPQASAPPGSPYAAGLAVDVAAGG